jgi:hypothetical protein
MKLIDEKESSNNEKLVLKGAKISEAGEKEFILILSGGSNYVFKSTSI